MSKSKPAARSIAKNKTPDTKNDNGNKHIHDSKNQIPEILEDMHDMIENSTNFTIDYIKSLTDGMNITTDLFLRMFLGASECANDIHNKNFVATNDSIKCSNAFDILDFHHKLFDNNYGLCNQYGIKCGEHVNKFASDVSDIMKYNLTNNWLVKFRNKKSLKRA